MAVCVLAVAGVSSAPALVVPSGNMAEPTNYVGWWRGATGVAVGPRHVLSARHLAGVAGEGFQLDGQWYTAVRVTNHPQLDIALIVVDRDLPGYHPIASRIRKGDRVLLAGLGRGAAGIDRGGVSWSDLRTERWGENVVAGAKKGLITVKLRKPRKALAHEAVFAHGDSGGGVFVGHSSGVPALAGIAVGADGDGYSRYGASGYALDVTGLMPWILANQ